MTRLTCQSCGVLAGEGQWACSECGASLYQPRELDPTSPRKSCTSCGGPTESGWLALHAESPGPATSMFMLQALESPRAAVLETETCTACGHIDLYRA